MTDAQSPPTVSAGLLLSMEQNLAEHACHLHRSLPDMRVATDGDVVIADSGISEDTFNVIAAARFTPETAPARIAATTRELIATGRPFSWWVGPTSTPPDLSTRLDGAGMPCTERTTAMWADLTEMPVATHPSEAVVRIVRTPTELADYAHVVAANWDPPSTHLPRFLSRAAAAALASDAPTRFVVAYVNDRPVSCAEVFLHAGVAGVYNVCTLRGKRQRGHGEATTLAALEAAREHGYTTAVLQASFQATSIYRRLGFHACGTFSEHAVSG